MKKYLLLALLLAAAPAYATHCDNGGVWPKCETPKPPTPPTTQPPSNHNEQNQTNGQSQGQSQGQGQGQSQRATGGSSRSNSTATGTGYGGAGGHGGAGGNAAATGGNVGDTSSASRSNATGGYSGGNRLSNGSASTSGASANGEVNVDTSDRSVTNVQGARNNFFAPGDLPSNAMNIVAGAYITTAGDKECGVLVTKVRTPVYQWDKKGKHKREVGYDEDVAPFIDANGVQIDYQPVYTGNGEGYMRGSHVTYVLGSSGGSNSSQLGLQGYAAGGGGGLSWGNGSAYSQAGVRLIVRPCIAYKFAPVAKPVVHRPVAKKRPLVRRPAAKPACQARPARPATTCPVN